MIFKLIAVIILVVTYLCDKSGIRKAGNKDTKVADRRVELYKTISYVLLALFWGFLKQIQIWVPLIIGVNVLAYVRFLIHPELIQKASMEKKTFPTLSRMFIICGINLGVLIILNTLLFNTYVMVLIIAIMLALFIPFLVCGICGKAKVPSLIPFLAPIFFFASGCIFSVNSFYGVKSVARVETVVSDIHISRRADSFSIPVEDALDGKNSFSGSAIGRKVGDSVVIIEKEGCLGIRWFVVRSGK